MDQKEVLKGTVRDWVLDCGYLVVSDGESDILHEALQKFEDKWVRITIEALDIMEDKVEG